MGAALVGCGCLYLVLGLGVHDRPLDDFYHRNYSTHAAEPLADPLGRIAFGYEARNGIEFVFEHTSQITAKDTGLNVLWMKKRWNLRR